MTQNSVLYIEIMVQPAVQYEKNLDSLELTLCNCIYYGFNHIVINLELIKNYDIMFLTPLYELLKDLEFSGGSFIITHPPHQFQKEFQELYHKSSIELIESRDSIINESRDILHTFLEDAEDIPTILENEAAELLRTIKEPTHEPVEDELAPSSNNIKLEVIEPEVIDSKISYSYFNPEKGIEICTISGEYICTTCNRREYFLKGFPFDACPTPECNGDSSQWKLTKKVF